MPLHSPVQRPCETNFMHHALAIGIHYTEIVLRLCITLSDLATCVEDRLNM